jgi:hypothetical protein
MYTCNHVTLYTKQKGEVKSPWVFTYSPCNNDLELSYWHLNQDQQKVPTLPFFQNASCPMFCMFTSYMGLACQYLIMIITSLTYDDMEWMTGNNLSKLRTICSHIVNINTSSSCNVAQCVPSYHLFTLKDWQQEIIQVTEINFNSYLMQDSH